jgi:hypothetical protein
MEGPSSPVEQDDVERLVGILQGSSVVFEEIDTRRTSVARARKQSCLKWRRDQTLTLLPLFTEVSKRGILRSSRVQSSRKFVSIILRSPGPIPIERLSTHPSTATITSYLSEALLPLRRPWCIRPEQCGKSRKVVCTRTCLCRIGVANGQ